MTIQNSIQKTFIRVRNEFEGFHCYPGAGDIDSRIKFLESRHRHLFKIESKISVTHSDRELEFFLVKWSIQEFLTASEMNNKSCEMIASDILEFLKSKYGYDRYYEITVSEDGESDGIVEYVPHV